MNGIIVLINSMERRRGAHGFLGKRRSRSGRLMNKLKIKIDATKAFEELNNEKIYESVKK